MDTTTLQNRRRVRVWLAGRDLTQRWLADALGVSEATLSLALSGERDMTDSIRDGIFRITGLRLRERKAA
jgi:transcriptional regulator with XRE-family HTH domain